MPSAPLGRLTTSADGGPVAHHLRGVADRRLGRDDDRRAAQQRRDGLVRRVAAGRRRGRRALVRGRPRLGEQRAGDEGDGLGSREHRDGDVLGDAVAEGVLVGARGEARGQPREHRAVAEQLPGAEQVEHQPVVRDLDGAAAHDADVRDRLGPLLEDRLALAVELDLGGGGDARDLLRGEDVERRVRAQELGDVGERGRSGRRLAGQRLPVLLLRVHRSPSSRAGPRDHLAGPHAHVIAGSRRHLAHAVGRRQRELGIGAVRLDDLDRLLAVDGEVVDRTDRRRPRR